MRYINLISLLLITTNVHAGIMLSDPAMTDHRATIIKLEEAMTKFERYIIHYHGMPTQHARDEFKTWQNIWDILIPPNVKDKFYMQLRDEVYQRLIMAMIMLRRDYPKKSAMNEFNKAKKALSDIKKVGTVFYGGSYPVER